MLLDPPYAPPVVDARFNGPDGSGNGGYVSGLVAERLARLTPGGPVTVTLRTPPPLGRPLRWRDADGLLALLDGDRLVAEARTGDLGGHGPVEPVSPAEARRATEAFTGFGAHPFPRCFGCGPERAEGDGLRVFSGPVGDGRVACLWWPGEAFAGGDGLLAPEFLWAALDCPGGWAAGAGTRPLVLGRMTARLVRRPTVGEPCVIVGTLRSVEGRKSLTATTIYGSAGDIVGRAEQTWITIDLEAFS